MSPSPENKSLATIEQFCVLTLHSDANPVSLQQVIREADLPACWIWAGDGEVHLFCFCEDVSTLIETLTLPTAKVNTQWGEEALQYLLEHTIVEDTAAMDDMAAAVQQAEAADDLDLELSMLMKEIVAAQEKVKNGTAVEKARKACKKSFLDWLEFRSLLPTVQALRTRLNEIRAAEIDYLRRKDPGMNIQQVEMITGGIIDKIARQFVDHLKENHQLSDKKVKAIKDIFQLDTDA